VLDLQALVDLAGAAGVGGVALGVCYLLVKRLLDRKAEAPHLPTWLTVVVLVGAFGIGVAGIGAWAAVELGAAGGSDAQAGPATEGDCSPIIGGIEGDVSISAECASD
jgi:uncharacterized membrane protein YedE/YeeE